MNAEHWPRSSEPWSILDDIGELRPSVRKTRLWNAAVCRRFWTYLPDESKAILIESERIADSGREPSDELELSVRASAVVARFNLAYPTRQYPDQETRIRRDAAAAVSYAVMPHELQGTGSYFENLDHGESVHHIDIIRDIFATLFRPIAFDPAWRTDTAVDIAKGMYESRDFGAMPILADALQDAGCDNDDVLDHCRDANGTHVRGCWVVDLVHGKA